MKLIYFDLKYALKVHKKIIEISGGAMGYRDKDYLSAIVDFAKDDDYYPTFPDKVSYIFFSVAKSHVFTDGNKRTAIALASYLLELNGFGDSVGIFIIHMESIVVWLVENKVSREVVTKVIESILRTGDLEEEILLLLIGELISD